MLDGAGLERGEVMLLASFFFSWTVRGCLRRGATMEHDSGDL